ncbi:MAG: Eco57I restriction-modification methylase domain-containing protein [Candidatus Hodarchaeota archaeon]
MKSLGAIYTPDSIATSMCESVLIEYINSELSVSYPTYRDLLMEKDIRKQRPIIETLRRITILDPACGSGHFLLTMLFRLENIYLEFKKTTPKLVPFSELDIREHIILNNLFGVDIHPKAIETCKLRLSHAIAGKNANYAGINLHPRINLHIRNGNSVIGLFMGPNSNSANFPKKQMGSLIEGRNKLILQYEEATGQLASIKAEEILQKTKELSLLFTKKLLCMKGFEAIKRQYSVEQFDEKFNPFHWIMEFSQVLGTSNNGFDIVIGNPPYVKADSQDETFQQYREIAKKLFDTFEEKWDLYIAFLELGLKLLKSRGLLSFIISDSFGTAKYARKMRLRLLSKKLLTVSFFPDIKLFPHIGVHSIIITVRNEPFERSHKTQRIIYESVDKRKSIENANPLTLGERLFRYIPQSNLLFTSQMKNTIPLGEICYISKGMVLNSDEKRYKGEFMKKDLISTKRSAIHWKPYIENKLIREFCILGPSLFLEYGTDRMPSRVSRPTFPELYTNEKLLVGKMGGRAIYDDQGYFCNDSLMIVIPYHELLGSENRVLRRKKIARALLKGSKISPDYNLRYLLGIINSCHATSFFNSIRSHRLKNYVNPNELKQLPIFKATKEQQSKIVVRVRELEKNRNLRKETNEEKARKELDEEYREFFSALNREIKILYDLLPS